MPCWTGRQYCPCLGVVASGTAQKERRPTMEDAITRKEHIVIIYHGKVAPKYGENPFYREVILSVKVYSTYLHSFCGLRTILLKRVCIF